jgi:hypothetical protein
MMNVVSCWHSERNWLVLCDLSRRSAKTTDTYSHQYICMCMCMFWKFNSQMIGNLFWQTCLMCDRWGVHGCRIKRHTYSLYTHRMVEWVKFDLWSCRSGVYDEWMNALLTDCMIVYFECYGYYAILRSMPLLEKEYADLGLTIWNP